VNHEYVADPRPSLHTIQAALDGAFTLRRLSEGVKVLTFYDTFDALLREAGMTVAVTSEDEIPAEARTIAGVRALLPLASVRVHSETVALLDELDKTVLRVELLAPEGLAPRVLLHQLRGYGDVAEQFRSALSLSEAETSLRDEAIIAAGGRPEGVSAKVRVELEAGVRADAAVVTVLEALWEVIDANLEGTIAGTDTEFLHDLRVSVRKSRAVLKEFPGVFAPEPLAFWRGEFRWLQQVSGDTRDLDVYLEDYHDLVALVGEGDRAALGPLKVVLGARRDAARRLMVRELRSERAHALARGWGGFMAALTGVPIGDRPDAERSIDAVASARIARVYRRMVKAGSGIGAESPAEDYHELRKQGKELRYLLELFGLALHDGDVVKPMVKALKDLQDVLGRHQDREVQGATIRGLAGAVASQPGGPDALIAMGVLVRALNADERAARQEFAEAFAAFSSSDQRSLVKRTFGRSG
jgi:CHAD domain-containing protein